MSISEPLLFCELYLTAMHEAGHYCATKSLKYDAYSVIYRSYDPNTENSPIRGVTFTYRNRHELDTLQVELIGIAGLIAERLDAATDCNPLPGWKKSCEAWKACLIADEFEDPEEIYPEISDSDRKLLQPGWINRITEHAEHIVGLEEEIRSYSSKLIHQFIFDNSEIQRSWSACTISDPIVQGA